MNHKNFGTSINRMRWTRFYQFLFAAAFVAPIAVLALAADLRFFHDPLALVLIGLAAFRGGRAIAYNYIFDWLRAPFAQVVLDSSGAGNSLQANGSGLRRVLGELLCCPICAGSWVALVLAGLMVVAPPFGIGLAFVLAASGIGEILNWRTGRDEWQGQAAREAAGTAWLRKNAPHRIPARRNRAREERMTAARMAGLRWEVWDEQTAGTYLQRSKAARRKHRADP
jgi:hypothetical protein